MKAHLKSKAAPRFWPIFRKATKFVARPKPGKRFEYSIPLSLALKLSGTADNTKEVKAIIHTKRVLINKKRVVSHRIPFGLMDVMELPDIKKAYRLLINRKQKLFIQDISDEDYSVTLGKVINKTTLKKGVIQCNLFDSTNVLLDDKVEVKVGDTVVLDLATKKIKDVLPMVEGATVYFIAGNFTGMEGKVVRIKGDAATFEHNNQQFETRTDYAYVIGKEKALIRIEQNGNE